LRPTTTRSRSRTTASLTPHDTRTRAPRRLCCLVNACLSCLCVLDTHLSR
jgi:hypothetical protein